MTPTIIRRAGVAGAFGLLALAAFVSPVAAAQSSTEEFIMGLNRDLLILAVPIAIFMEGLLIYTVFRFRNNEEPKPTGENRSLEISWTVATALILLFVGFASYQVLAQPAVTAPATAAQAPDDAVQVDVTAQQFVWQFEYPEENVTSLNTLVLPVNRTIYMTVTSEDVIHSVHVPALALKQDAVPGQVNALQTTVTEEGTYQLYCAEYCGSGHSKMLATVKVVNQTEYEDWLQEQQTQGGN
ncbi:MAG: cytochrome c oxidase subunit II [Halanaeroarchaeum sp.]